MLIQLFLKINKLFPVKDHPFNTSKNGVLDLNYSDFEYQHTPELLQQYSDYIDLWDLKESSVLDVWCGGWGKAVYLAEKYNATVIGTDVSENFLKQATLFAKEKDIKNTTFVYQDARKMDFKDETFDYIILSDVIEHIPDTEVFLAECLRVLKKGGKVLFDFAPYYHYFGHHLWDTLPIPWLHLFTSESFRIKLYSQTLLKLPDGIQRKDLRISTINNTPHISYLNKITIKKFDNIVKQLHKKSLFSDLQINYYMLKNIKFLSKVPLIRELAIRHIVWTIKK